MRHPGYLGSILIWIALVAALSDWIGILVIVPLMIGVSLHRIQAGVLVGR
jgi:protein-S-isoprenylcysteine O-methyltransferase Ste14